MRLFHSPLAPNARRVRMFLAEKGLEVPLAPVDLAKLEQKDDGYSAVNPFQLVPALELDDGSVIVESIAICRYFEELHPAPPLFGVGAREKALVEMWNRRIELEIFAPVGNVWSHLSKIAEGRGRRIPEFGEIQKRAAINRIAWLDTEMRNREFIAGDRYSIADITTLCMIDFARTVDIRIQPEQTGLARWYGSVSSRPSAKA